MKSDHATHPPPRSRFHPTPFTGLFPPHARDAAGARFGNTFDDWGNRFLCNIRNPAEHVALPSRYLARNPLLAVRSAISEVAAAGDQLPVYRVSPVEAWREARSRRWAGERDNAMPRSELVGAGVVTSSSGITVYRGSTYPPEFQGNIFTAECAGNLLRRWISAPRLQRFWR